MRTTTSLPFHKYCGAGNDFIIIEAASGSLDAQAVRRLCHRRFGIGADGLMLFQATEAGFSIDFYNADGYGGVLCGNGARCALAYAAAMGHSKAGNLTSFDFAGRSYSGRVLATGQVEFNLNPAISLEELDSLDWPESGSSLQAWLVELGSRHLVLDAQPLAARLADLDVETLGRQLRWHPRFQPEGTNVHFCRLLDGRVHIRSFERGVEAETLACGTGSTAAALAYASMAGLQPPVRVVTAGGAELLVSFDQARQPGFLRLCGPAQQVFSGRVDLADL